MLWNVNNIIFHHLLYIKLIVTNVSYDEFQKNAHGILIAGHIKKKITIITLIKKKNSHGVKNLKNWLIGFLKKVVLHIFWSLIFLPL